MAAAAIVDAHHHLWDPDRRPYPWMTGDLEALRRPRGLGDLRAVTEPAGVGETVVVQATSSEEETTDLLRQAAASDGLVAAVVGWVDLTAPDVAGRIAALRAGEGGERLAGIRHQVQDEPDPEWLLRADVRRGLQAVAAAGLVYDLLLLPVHLPAALQVADELDALALVVDHGAKPPIAAGGWEPWSSDLAALAARERVHCKLSGLVTEAPWDGWREAGIERYAMRLLELFGPARLMFGSDWPVCTLAASYGEVLDLARAALAGLGDGERDEVLGETARRFYGLDGRGR
jgi:L-fuconolactonase